MFIINGSLLKIWKMFQLLNKAFIYANSACLDEMPFSLAYQFGLHCIRMFH